MHETEIKDEEFLYRVVKVNPNLWKEEEKRPSSASFKDSFGVSVDRQGGRTKEKVIFDFIERFGQDEIKAVIRVTAGFCRDKGAFIKNDINDDGSNDNHALILRSENEITLTSSVARALSKESEIVHMNSDL